MITMEGADPLWTTEKIATYFSVEPSTVLRWIADDEMKNARKINNRWRVPQSEVFAYRDRKYAEGAAK